MLNILLAEENVSLRKEIKDILKDKFTIYEADNGLEALETSKRENISIYLINSSMPFITGKDFLESFNNLSTTPIVFYGKENDALKEEYPFLHITTKDDAHSLVRIIEILKEIYFGESDNHRYYKNDDLEIDYYAKKLKIKDKLIKLTPKEVDLLIFLCINEGTAYSREDLLTKVWGYDFLGDSRTVDTHVKSLRAKLGDHRNLISTIWGKGYKFERPHSF